MTPDEWIATLPLHPIRTGVSVNLRLDIYSDGHGDIVCADDANVSLPVDKKSIQSALRQLWERAVREATVRNYFKS